MKHLLIVLAILMLGCGTDTEMVDEPTPVVDEPTPVVDEPLPVEVVDEPPLVVDESPPVVEEPTPVAEEPTPIAEESPRLLKESTVGINHRNVDDPAHIMMTNVDPANGPFDPVLLNQNGIFFEFDEDLGLFKADLLHDGKSLGWFPRAELTGDEIGDSIKITPPPNGPFLEYNKEYYLDMTFLDNAKAGFKVVMKFRTIRKP